LTSESRDRFWRCRGFFLGRRNPTASVPCAEE
jgi:hypothetical protein